MPAHHDGPQIVLQPYARGLRNPGLKCTHQSVFCRRCDVGRLGQAIKSEAAWIIYFHSPVNNHPRAGIAAFSSSFIWPTDDKAKMIGRTCSTWTCAEVEPFESKPDSLCML